MTSRRRRLLSVLGVTVLVLVVAVVAVRMLLPADRLVALAVERAAVETGAEIHHGDVGLSLWPRIAVQVSDLRVGLTGEAMAAASGNEAGPLVSLDASARRIDAGLAWGPLLKRRVELTRIEVDGLELIAVTEPAEAADETAAAQPPASAPVAVVLAGVSVRDGSFRWTEQGTGKVVVGDGWRQDASLDDVAVLGRRLAAFGAGAPLADDSGPASGLGLEGTLDRLVLEGVRPEGPMTLTDLAVSADCSVPAGAAEILLEAVEASWMETRVTGHGSVRPEQGRHRLVLDWTLDRLDPDGLQRALPALAPAVPEPWRGWLADAPVHVAGVVASGRYEALLPPAADAAPADMARGLKAEVVVGEARFTPPGMVTPWTCSAEAAVADGRLDVKPVAVAIGDGTLDGAVSLYPIGAPDAAVALEAALDGLPSAVVLETIVPSAAPYLEGDLDGRVSGSLRLGEPEAVRSSLTLDGESVLHEGVVHASEWLDGISRYLGERQDLKEIRYRSLSHVMKVREGRYVVDDLKLVGHDTDWTGGGWIGLDGAIDLDLNVKLPRNFRPDLGAMTPFAEALRGEDGRMALDLNLGGRAARPAVSVDLTVASGRLGSSVGEGVKGWLDKLKRND